MKSGWFILATLVCLGIQFLMSQLWAPLRYIDFFLLLTFQLTRAMTPSKAVGLSFLAGLAQDFSSSGLYPVGLQAIAKMTVGLLASVTNRHLDLDHPGLQTVFVFIFGCLNNGLIVLLFIIFGQTCPVQSLVPLLFGAACTALINFPVGLALPAPAADRLP